MPWTIAVPLLADESISSWLARAALAQGCDPLVLTGSIWPDWRVWTMDPDRTILGDRLLSLAEASGISPSRFAASGLRADAERIADRHLPHTETWPWILALGARNRRRHAGQQFCPGCLADDPFPYFRRKWRFAWNVACPKHKILLIDHCRSCSAPVAPHRLLAKDGCLARCHGCKTDLRDVAVPPAPDGSFGFQQAADNALIGGTGVFGKRLPVADWFAVAGFFVTLIRRASRHKNSKLAAAIEAFGVRPRGELSPPGALRLELLPASERHSLLDAIFRLMLAGPEALAISLRDNGVSAAALRHGPKPLPRQVTQMAAALPYGGRQPRTRSTTQRPRLRSEKSVMSAWARLRRKMKAVAS